MLLKAVKFKHMHATGKEVRVTMQVTFRLFALFVQRRVKRVIFVAFKVGVKHLSFGSRPYTLPRFSEVVSGAKK